MGWDDVEKDMLSRMGLSETDEAESDIPEVESPSNSPLRAGSCPPPPAPRSGTQPWGRWSHEGESVEIDIGLPPGARARDVTCEMDEGFLCVHTAEAQSKGEPPLLLTM